MADFRYLFTSIDLGPIQLRNRLMMTTHGARLSAARYVRYLEERARGGVGLIGIPAYSVASVAPSGLGRFVPSYVMSDVDGAFPSPVTKAGIEYYDQLLIPGLSKLAEAIHRQGARCVGQIHNAGAARHDDNFQVAVAPSVQMDEFSREVPHELDQDEIAQLVQALAHAARRIKTAGFDGVEIHAAHGYLINQFLSPFTNHRTDQYGGSVENRLRFLEEVISAIGSMVGGSFPIGIRVNGDELVDGGLSVVDMQEVATWLAQRVVYISVSGGSYAGLKDGLKLPYVAPWYVPLGPMVPVAAAIRSVVEIPVIVAGRINDPVLAEKILAEGCADVVGMTRALIADPEFPNKAREGRLDDIRKCIADVQCHYPGKPITCTVNAAAGREEEMEIEPAQVRKRVLVAGGGPAGMEAARVAAVRGHEVILCERGQQLGGNISIIARDPNRGEIGDSVRYLERQVEKLGVDVRLGVEVKPSLVAELKPDVVIVATGSEPYVPGVPGIDRSNVMTALDVLGEAARAGDSVLVVAGLDDHLAAPTIADFLAGQGKKVAVATESMVLGPGIEPSTQHLVTKRLLEKNVQVHTLTGLRSVGEKQVRIYNTFTREERALEVDTVVLACGNRPRNELRHSLNGTVAEIYEIGDCRAPRRLIHAILDGSRVGRMI